MKLTKLAVYRPVVALTVTLALAIFGVVSYFSLGLENNPTLKLPIVTVTASYPGASAQVVEEQVARKMEDAIATLGNIKTMTSTSSTGSSQIVVEFNEGVNQDVAAMDVQQKVSGVRSEMPSEVEEPSYGKLDFNGEPILNLAVTSARGAGDPLQLYRVADDVIRPKLENVEGVGRVTVIGGAKPEVQVEVLPDRLQAYGLTLDDVTTAVRSQFISASGGQVKGGLNGAQRSTSLRIDTREGDLGRLGAIPVTSKAGAVTELRNVARVYLGGKQPETLLRVNGQSSAGLLVYKQSTANIAETVDAVLPQVDRISRELPDGYRLETAIDTSVYVRETVHEVQQEFVLAAVITGIVLFFFLHNLRSTFIVLLAIPTSLLVALIAMKLSGLTLNGMTLIALTTAIGVLVDDSIVVLENIFSHLERGQEPKEAAVDGRSEIGMAAIAITLVDVAVWGPIVFMTGIVGAFLRNFALVMVSATLASLLVSFTLTPMVASRWLRAGSHGQRARGPLGRIAYLFEPIYARVEAVYKVVLHWSLRHRPVVLVLALLIFSSNFLILQGVGTEFVPEGDQDTVSVTGELPPGTALEATERAAKRWEMVLLDHDRFPEVHKAYIQVGAGGDSRRIGLTLDIGKSTARERTNQEISRAVIEAGEAIVPDMSAKRGAGVEGFGGQPVQIRVFGDSLDTLTQVAAEAEKQLAALPVLADVSNSLTATDEITIRPDPARLMDLGVSAAQIGTTIRAAYQGAEVGKWQEANGKERDVIVLLPPEVRNRPEAVASLPLFRRGDQTITLIQLAVATTDVKPTKITRVDRQRVATLGASPSGVPLGEANERVTQVMDGLQMPAGMRWSFAGESQEQRDSFASLGVGLMLSVVLMYMVLAVLYENWLQPLLIQTALPLATVGAFLGLLAFNQTLSLPSFIGLIGLFGLVGKNSILLVDRANDLRRHGMDRTTALEQAGPSRLRPILMTSAVLILSMLPVALELGGSGSGRAPLAAVLVGGMTTSTFLSLLYVPVAYTYFDSFGTLMGRLVRWRPRSRRRRAALDAAEAPRVAAPAERISAAEPAHAKPAPVRSLPVPAPASRPSRPPLPVNPGTPRPASFSPPIPVVADRPSFVGRANGHSHPPHDPDQSDRRDDLVSAGPRSWAD